MKRLTAYIFVLIVLAGLPAYADDGGTETPFSFGAGARDLSLGGAAAAISDGATAPFWNPSALARTQQFALSGFHSRLYDADVTYQYLGLAVPTLDWGCIGLSVFRLGIDGIEKRDANNLLLGEIDDNRMAFYLAYARNIGGYDIGLAVLVEHHSLDNYKATSSPGVNLSLGRSIRFKHERLKELTVALNGRNIIKPGIELVDERVRCPVAFDVSMSLKLAPLPRWNHAASFSFALNAVEHLDPKLSAGLEYSFHDLMHLRGGVRDRKLSVGGGLTYKSVSFDYALVDRDLGSIHMFSITTRFGLPLDQKRSIRKARREADFNNLMNERLTSRNRAMISQLLNSGRQKLEAGDLVEAGNQLDRALFLARGNGVDTTDIAELAAEARERLDDVLNKQMFAQYMDSAEFRLDAKDYLAARYFAGLALSKVPNSSDAKRILDRAVEALRQTATREETIRDRLLAIDSLISYGRIDQALVIVRSLEQLAPDDGRVKLALKKVRFESWKNAATLAHERRAFQEATEALDSALTLLPEHKWCLDFKAHIEQELQALQAASAPVREIKHEPLSPELEKEVEAAYQAAQNLFAEGKLAEAITSWEKVERLAPDFQSVRKYLVKAYKFAGVELYGQNQLKEAVITWRKAARLDPGNEEIEDYIKRTENEMRKMEELSYDHR
jgi:tetratricopeptide (TPR) repeat protein